MDEIEFNQLVLKLAKLEHCSVKQQMLVMSNLLHRNIWQQIADKMDELKSDIFNELMLELDRMERCDAQQPNHSWLHRYGTEGWRY